MLFKEQYILSSSLLQFARRKKKKNRTSSYRNSPQILPLQGRSRDKSCVGHVAFKYGFQFQRRKNPGQRMEHHRWKKDD